MIYSNEISDALDKFHSYIARNIAACKDHPAAKVSAFWSEHFADRTNFPDVRDFLVFRRGDYVYGIGDTVPGSPERKQQEFAMTLRSIGLFTPAAHLQALREPIVGSPLVYTLGENQLSTSYLLNAGTSWRVTELLRQHGLSDRPLRICEIGAGWGACASQLHQVCEVDSYTIVDLPENLCLSSTYLTTTMPGRQSTFIECDSASGAQGKLNFALPPAIDYLDGPFDVIINTMSFQEMDRETVDTYFAWAGRTLAPDGLLISFNAHDKAGILRPSDYLRKDLEICHLMPFRKVPAGYFNTIPYESVFRRTNTDTDAHQLISSAVDALGEMVQLGLDGDLAPLSRRALVEREQAALILLTRIRDFFYAPDEKVRQTALARLLQESPCALTLFLGGNYWFAQGCFELACKLLEGSLEQGLQDFAATRARVMLACQQNKMSDAKFVETLAGRAGGLDEDISRIVSARDISALQNHIARIYDCPVTTPVRSAGLVGSVFARLRGSLLNN
ncbi:hypothetical protein GWL_46430 [Herbaspirillum sp. GW103]|uniref:putative sugar O-methyltransferase n=1 Tax=Herbaspirillum sp. GW103 TaxID=1175306 RepID=UPI00025E50D9|nr:putative sugar O-methyltransferase [Herbaspirillum sp. GW103]EIJ45203.1 hypothetical protein GWL_46430 [Herbaspirillum sp. GW103]